MSASTAVFNRNLGRFFSQMLMRKYVTTITAVTTPKQSCLCGLRSLSSSSSSSISNCNAMTRKRFYTTDNDKVKDKQDVNLKPEESVGSSETWQDLGTIKNQKEGAGEEEEAEYEHSIRQRILDTSLNYVQDYGWTKEALEKAAEEEGLSLSAHGIFDRGGAEIVSHFYKKCNADLAEQMKAEVRRLKTEGLEKPKTRPFIQYCVETRLKMIVPYHNIWKEAMAIQTFPQNAPESWTNLMDLCDDIWYYAGDRSTNFDWYTKRLTLAAVYKATEIYMLQDTSEDYQKTWIFLDSRLNDLENVSSVRRNLGPMAEGLKGLLDMTRNIIGMNSRKR